MTSIVTLFVGWAVCGWVAASASLATPPVSARSVDASVRPIVDALGGVDILGFGQAAHGARESTSVAGRVFRALAARRGYTVFAIEAGWGDAHGIDRFVQGESGDVGRLLREQGEWIWNTAELRDIIVWMRAYNRTRGKHPALHFAGVDIERADSSLRVVERYVRKRGGAFASALSADLSCGYGIVIETYVASRTKAQRDRCAASLVRARSVLEHGPADPGRDEERKIALHALQIAIESQRLASAVPRPGERGAKAAAAFTAAFNIRDAAMAENAIWEAHRWNGRVVLLAHDQHVAREGLATARGASGPVLRVMGSVLAASLRTRYYALGQTFARGEIMAKPARTPERPPQRMRADPDPDDDTASLSSSRTGATFIDLRTLEPASPAGRWATTQHWIRDAGSVFDPERSLEPYVLARAFDGIVSFPVVHPVRLLPAR